MTESARATARTRPGARLRRLARWFGRGNEKKAAVAVARTLLCIAWAVMASGGTYAEQGEDFYDHLGRRNREHIAARYQQALVRLGYQVTLTPPDDANPPSDPGTPSANRDPGLGSLTVTAPHPRAERAGSAGAAARQAGVPKFRHRSC